MTYFIKTRAIKSHKYVQLFHLALLTSQNTAFLAESTDCSLDHMTSWEYKHLYLESFFYGKEGNSEWTQSLQVNDGSSYTCTCVKGSEIFIATKLQEWYYSQNDESPAIVYGDLPYFDKVLVEMLYIDGSLLPMVIRDINPLIAQKLQIPEEEGIFHDREYLLQSQPILEQPCPSILWQTHIIRKCLDHLDMLQPLQYDKETILQEPVSDVIIQQQSDITTDTLTIPNDETYTITY